MLGKDILPLNSDSGIKGNLWLLGIAGVTIGTILVIYYCATIKHYPTGLTISDSLFFLWTVILFGFNYSLVFFTFFVASIFWVTVIAKPVNSLFNRKYGKNIIVLPLSNTDLAFLIGVGLVANLLIVVVTHLMGRSFIPILGSFFLIGFIYVLISSVSRKAVGDNVLVDFNGNSIRASIINPKVVKIILYVLIYNIPLLFAGVGKNVTHSTFETMGIRQMNVDVLVESKNYKSILIKYKDSGFILNCLCSDACLLEGINVLFTGIGLGTKIEMNGPAGKIEMVIPSKSIQLIANKDRGNANSIKSKNHVDE